MTQNFVAKVKRIALSSQRSVFKTEEFIAETRKILGIDAFISRVAEGIFAAGISLDGRPYCASTEDGKYSFFICETSSSVDGEGLVFYKFMSAAAQAGGIDRGLKEYISSKDEVPLVLRESDEPVKQEDLLRLYLASGSDGMINFPRLNENQRKIVETQDANVLVQGVAGSGKTNVCIEKIVYCACRGYKGRALYSTYSRGLLSETRERVELFKKNIDGLLEAYERGDLDFLDPDHKKAIENKLGIPFDVDEDADIFAALKRISAYLADSVDYFLIEDLYARKFQSRPVADESVFVNEYLSGKGMRLSGAIEKIKNISPEIIYKEIFGMIFGKYELDDPRDMMEKTEYIKARSESFAARESEVIYSVATDYADFIKKRGYTDNNFMSRELLAAVDEPEYSVGIIDEVQDFTQVNLCLIKKLCRKMFCVGDALQMINPSYFNFGYLKRLMYGDVSGVSELRHNYRSTERIEKIAEKLGEMNIAKFGTHSFVLKGESVPSSLTSEAAFVKDKSLVYALSEKRFENLTVIVGSKAKKEKLKKALGKIEVLTVSEAKGLERNAVVLVDVLSDNADKWRYLQQMSLNRKTADENSVFRYYFNLFYVGVSRARRHLMVVEADYPKFFDKLFDECFERKNRDRALALLRDIAGKLEIDDDEFTDRIQKFCALEQYDNARAAADRLSTDELRAKQLLFVDLHEKYLRFGNFKEAGIEYWRRGYDDEARQMFVRSGDEELFPLMDACREGGERALSPDIVRFYSLVEGNELAKNIILETLNKDCNDISAALKSVRAELRR